MGRRLIHHLNQKCASAITGAFFFASLSLCLPSCDKHRGTPEWKPAEEKTISTKTASPKKSATALSARKSENNKSSNHPSSDGLRFVCYNLENWLKMDRLEGHDTLANSPKPESQRNAVIQILANNAPDAIGVCEIGEPTDLAEIQTLLKKAGLDLPHSQFISGADPIRHLGFLSRFPIIAKATPAETDYQMNGKTYGINRGILDVTINAYEKNYRFIGVHLKSKRTVEDVDQEEMRIHEARLLRRHLDSIFHENEKSRLIVYGDFNDSRSSTAFKSVMGSYGTLDYLTAIPLKDSQGESWTHYWSLNDIYSRIDYIAVTQALKGEVNFSASRIIDDPAWSDASDHRALMAVFK